MCGSARPWGVSFSTAGSWGENRGCLGVEGSSGPWGPHAATLQLPSCCPPTAYVHPAFIQPRCTGVCMLQAPAGPREDHGGGEGGSVHAETGPRRGGRGHKAGTPTLQPTFSLPSRGTPVSTPHRSYFCHVGPHSPLGPKAEGEEGSGARPPAPLGRLESGEWLALL